MDLDEAYHHRRPIEVSVQQRDGKRAAPLPDTAAAKNSAKRPQLSDYYDADVDFNLREMERKQTGNDLAIWMGEFTRHYRLPPDTLHRAFSYVDRALSAPTAHGDYDLHLLGAAAIYAAAKYEGRRLNAADIAWYCGFAASKELTDMAQEMLATHLLETNGGMCLR